MLLASLGVTFPQTVTLTFTGRDAVNNYVQLDSVSVVNMTRSWQEILYWPDTVLKMQVSVGIDDNDGPYHGESMQLFQNNPNPFNGGTDVTLYVADAGAVALELTDVNGRFVETWHATSLQNGCHKFRITIANAGTYVLTARQNGKSSSIKMVNNGGGTGNGIEYMGTVAATRHGTSLQNGKTAKSPKLATTYPFKFGDLMEYVGYATINDNVENSQSITQSQNDSQTFTLQFEAIKHGVPCPGIPTITDVDSNTYNTVQIGNQCWMRENLRTTKYADGTDILQGPDNSTSTTIAYWYYPNGSSDNKPTYGLIYNWKAVMRNSASSNSNPSGVQGICPTGWHLPSDAEWTQLTDFVSSQSIYCCGTSTAYIAKALASTTGWQQDVGSGCTIGNDLNKNNATGFSALPAGFYHDDYMIFRAHAYLWSSTSDGGLWIIRELYYNDANIYKFTYNKGYAYSVRCLKD